jgi:hypothetical protein
MVLPGREISGALDVAMDEALCRRLVDRRRTPASTLE